MDIRDKQKITNSVTTFRILFIGALVGLGAWNYLRDTRHTDPQPALPSQERRSVTRW